MPPFWPFLILFAIPPILLILWVASASLREGGAVDEEPTLNTRGADVSAFYEEPDDAR